ncbi:putative DsbA family dithiol-disulfide isomerase [Rhizobium aquaticum]|uniref:DsbA family dithiol-disulfide isomerase n=1 Tax=Rhizobium aquaticum TaxID=1549636 RepID=A0ABV2IVY0_9HYPH
MRTVSIDIVSDVVCPWCYLGKARLEQALAMTAGQADVAITWRPYRLNPDIPAEGIDHQAWLASKFGGKDKVDSAHAQIAQYGKEAGIEYDFDAIKVGPNTLNAHRLLHWALQHGRDIQNKVADMLFKANFKEGRNVGDHKVLVEIAREAGMDGDVIAKLLESDADKDDVLGEIEAAQKMGVSGVPFFILDGKYGVSGAQMPETLAGAILQLANDEGGEEG